MAVKLNSISVFVLIFILNIFYSFCISPYGTHQTFGLAPKYTGRDYQEYIHADARQYIHMGMNIANGKGISASMEESHPTAIRMPGYPAYLAGIFRAFGINLKVALMFQCFLLTVFIYISYLLAKGLFSEKVAFSSLLVLGLCPNLKFYGCAYLGSETLAGIVFMGSLYVFIKDSKNAVELRRRTIWGSMLFALSVFTRPDFIFFLPFFIIWLLKERRYQIRTIVILLVVLLFTIAPWTLRNYKVFNCFVPFTTGLGDSLAGSYNPQTVRSNPGGWDSLDFDNFAIDLENKNEAVRSKLKTQYAVKQIRSLNSGQITKLMVCKLIRLWFPAQRVFRTNKGVVNIKSLFAGKNISDMSMLAGVNILFALVFLPFYILFWLGLYKLVREGQITSLVIMLFLYMNIIALLFWGSLRLRFVFEPVIIIVACWYWIEGRKMSKTSASLKAPLRS
jgi:hypothetical protein